MYFCKIKHVEYNCTIFVTRNIYIDSYVFFDDEFESAIRFVPLPIPSM